MTAVQSTPGRQAGPGTIPTTTAGAPPAAGVPFARLTAVELRKLADTRAGLWLLIVIVLAAAATTVIMLAAAPDEEQTFAGFFAFAQRPAGVLLPVLGILSMTSEWTQRTALTTFTLSPRRVRVQLAKFVSAIVLSAVVLTVVVLFAFAGTALAGAVTDHSTTYAGLGGQLAGSYLTVALNVVMGAAFGAVLAQTAVALLVFYIAPTAWALAGPALFKDNANWLDVFGAFGRIAERDLHGMLPETLTAIGVWIVVPTVVGLWASSRREVK